MAGDDKQGFFERTGRRVGRWLDRHAGAAAVGSALLLLSALSFDISNRSRIVILAAGILIGIAGYFLRHLARSQATTDVRDPVELATRNAELEREVIRLTAERETQDASYRRQFERFLGPVADSIGLPAGQRITVFKHQGDYFVPLGRYCANPYLAKPGRSKIAIDEPGCLRAAFRTGEHCVSGLPDPKADPRGFGGRSLDVAME